MSHERAAEFSQVLVFWPAGATLVRESDQAVVHAHFISHRQRFELDKYHDYEPKPTS